MKNKLSPKAKNIRDKEGMESPGSAPSVLRMPVDVYSFSLALLTGLAVIFVLHWAKAIFIPLMLGVMISYTLPIVEKAGTLRSIAGPMLNLYSKAKKLLQGGKCEIFYAGSVEHPE